MRGGFGCVVKRLCCCFGSLWGAGSKEKGGEGGVDVGWGGGGWGGSWLVGGDFYVVVIYEKNI